MTRKAFIPQNVDKSKPEQKNLSAISSRSEQISSGLTKRIHFLDPEKIATNPYQPRKHFDPESISELAEDIKRDGQLQPALVIDTGERYVLVIGERRLRACKEAGLPLEAVLENGSEQTLKEDSTRLKRVAIMENVKREDLNIIEKAESISELYNSNEYNTMKKKEFALAISMPYSTLNRLFDILKLPDYIKNRVRHNSGISIRALESLSRFDEETAVALFDKIIEGELNNEESLSMIGESRKNTIKSDKKATPKTPSVGVIKHLWGSVKTNEKKMTIEIATGKADKDMLDEIKAVIQKYSSVENQ